MGKNNTTREEWIRSQRGYAAALALALGKKLTEEQAEVFRFYGVKVPDSAIQSPGKSREEYAREVESESIALAEDDEERKAIQGENEEFIV